MPISFAGIDLTLGLSAMFNSSEQHLYTRSFDPDGQDSLAKIVRLMRAGTRVLDLGTGPGILGKYLSERLSCRVDGIEYNPLAAEVAAPHYDKLVVADLEKSSLSELFPESRYDYIVCADVLEHLSEPGRIVDQLASLLRPGGRVLISIPNVAYVGVIADLLAGEFLYRPEGLLDETHLRFFTRRSLLDFLAKHGLRVCSQDSVTVELRHSEFARRYLDAFPPALVRGLLARPDALTYQFIVEASFDEGDGDLPELPSEPTSVPELRFACQLFWACGAEDLVEGNSVIACGRIGEDRQSLELVIPPLSQGLTALRLDLADRPGLLRLFEMTLFDHEGRLCWAWDGLKDSLAGGWSQQIAFAELLPGIPGVTLLLTGEDPALDLPVPKHLLARIDEGGSVRLTVSWPMSMDYLALAQHCVPAKDMLRLKAELESRIDALESRCAALDGYRQELEGQVKALAANNAESAARNGELESRNAEMESHIGVIESRLEERSQSVRQLASESDYFRNALNEIQRSTLWRWSRPYVNAVVWMKKTRRRLSARAKPLALPPRPLPIPAELRVDIIIPAYRGLDDTRQCIESVLRQQQRTGHEVIVINDASPEPELVSYLTETAAGGRITLLENQENLGFVQSVNRGMRLHEDRDVVLLNSDTQVAGDWLDRLVGCVYSDRAVGTVTPFSNNATICSYPEYCADNDLPAGWTVDDLDALFRRINAGKSIEIPTAVGFCMYIRRDCLREVGLFDVDNFGKGYGEENDFCMRAAESGWRHLLCADTFVLHRGGISFADQQNAAKARAMETIRRLHPGYERAIHEHIAQDPARGWRLAIDVARLIVRSCPRVLLVTHGVGGGTAKHVAELVQLFADSLDFLVLCPVASGQHSLIWRREGEVFELFFRLPDDYALLCDLVRDIGISRIHFHHFKGVDDSISRMPQDLALPYDYTVHDYYFMCPQVSLTTLQSRYCGEPGEAVCNRCLRLAPPPGGGDIQSWRDRFAKLLAGAERVFAPSFDVSKRIKRHVPAARVLLAPHPEAAGLHGIPSPRVLPVAADEPLRIAVLGALSPVKGPDLLEQCALDAKQRDLALEFHLLGYAYRDLITAPRSRLTVHGAYRDSELPTLLADLKPHLVWFPAQWPETYSYTLSACLHAGLPIVAPDLGAFPERLYDRPWTWCRPWQWDAASWNDFFLSIRSEHFIPGVPPLPPQGEIAAPEFDYREDYLVASTLSPPRSVSDNLLGILIECAYPRLEGSRRPAADQQASSGRAISNGQDASWWSLLHNRMSSAWQGRVKNWLTGPR